MVTTRDIYTRTYSGSIPGLTIRVQAEDVIDLDFVNDLPENEDANDTISNHNFPYKVNSTNFHTHGLHVPPTGDADNVHRELEPQTSHKVGMTNPDNHNPGTF